MTYQLPGTHFIVLGEREGMTATNVDFADLSIDAVFSRAYADLDPVATVGRERSP